LAQLYGRTTLSIFMVDRLLEAIRDVPPMAPAELFDRFLAWTRTPTAGTDRTTRSAGDGG
jgi:hypothetical protein